jgi:two-component system response regulator FlrC
VAHAALAAEQVSRALVGRTVAEVERDLILETLKHCLGNRTHAANVLGISIRTLRNKLNEYAVRRAGAAAGRRRAARGGVSRPSAHSRASGNPGRAQKAGFPLSQD